MTKQASPAAVARFQDDRFGLFIHWGLYSIPARQEWIMHLERIPVPEYEKFAAQFNPTKFDAEEWVSIAADAGQRYITITSRHHDGFSMYDTALSDYKVTHTPFGRDPIAELAAACARRSDIRLGFYVSLLDWHHPAYRFRAESGLAWADYIAFLHGQVRELCTNFGDLANIWMDGHWPRQSIDETNAYFEPGGSFEYETLYDMIHTLQPGAVIMNNRHDTPLPGEDIQGFEQDLPGANTAGFNTTEVSALPGEVAMTINDHWGVHTGDRNTKSTRHLLSVLVRSASAGANLLLNVGPTAEGEILPEHAQRLRNMGHWLRLNGAGVYGTRAGAIPPTEATVSTRRGDTHYIHILHDISDSVRLTGVPAHLTRARLLHDGTPVSLIRESDSAVFTVPEPLRDPLLTVVELT